MQPHLPNAIALAIVVVMNWLLSHLATDWVMPSEVAQAVQSLLIALLTLWVVQPPNGESTPPAGSAASPAPLPHA